MLRWVLQLREAAAKVGGLDAILFRYNLHHNGEHALNLAIDFCEQPRDPRIRNSVVVSMNDSTQIRVLVGN